MGTRGYLGKSVLALSQLFTCTRTDVADMLCEDLETGVTWFAGTSILRIPQGLG